MKLGHTCKIVMEQGNERFIKSSIRTGGRDEMDPRSIHAHVGL